MTTGALATSAAHPLYLYVVFVACVLGAVALLIAGWVSHRRSSWPRHWQTQSTQRTDAKDEPAYPVEPAAAPVTLAVPEATASVPAKKTTARKTSTATATRTAAKKTTAAASKKTAAAKKTTPRKTSE